MENLIFIFQRRCDCSYEQYRTAHFRAIHLLILDQFVLDPSAGFFKNFGWLNNIFG